MTSRRFLLPLLAALALPLPASARALFWWDQAPKASGAQEHTPAATAQRPGSGRIDRILVKKSERRLYLMRGNQPVRTYRIALGYQPTGHKRYQGDGRTPEGRYYLDWRSTASKYYKALHISYPSVQDRLRALGKGQDPGGQILIHGQPGRQGGERSGDWTFGCIAVSNLALDEIWSYTNVGTPIEILP